MPSQIMLEQCLLEILEEVSQKIDPNADVFEKAYLLDGEHVTSPL